MQDTNWDDYRVAYQVAQSGSLAKAAQHLGCNHATVLRHVNRLEKALNIKLFIRNQRGYKLSDAGKVMVNEMPNIFEEFHRMENLMGSVEQDITGNLRITSLTDFTDLLNPALVRFRKNYPQLRIQLISTDEIIPLSSGAAHVSLRVGKEPNDPDLIARKIFRMGIAYYATDSYVQEFGLPSGPEEYNQHQWAMPSIDKYHIPFVKHVINNIDFDRVVFQSNHFPDVHSAVAAGMGIGLMPLSKAEEDPTLHKLEIQTDEKDDSHLWFVYHKDLKNNAKVKTLYTYLLESLEEH